MLIMFIVVCACDINSFHVTLLRCAFESYSVATCQGNNYLYTVSGFVAHVSGGHFVAYVRSQNQWLLCNDATVRVLSVKFGALQRKVPHCQLDTGCPVAPLNMLQVDVQLGLICVGEVEASFVRALVAFNDVQLPDEEALQQDNTAISAMRVKRSVDCLLSGATETSVTHRAKLRSAGPASAVNWMLQGRAGEAHLVVLAHTEEDGEWSLLWHVPVDAHRVEEATRFLMQLYQNQR